MLLLLLHLGADQQEVDDRDERGHLEQEDAEAAAAGLAGRCEQQEQGRRRHAVLRAV
jgi:hypothetical protein